MKRYHFITGLPRSGSTLLASILNQNPRFHASIQSPVGQAVCDLLAGLGPRNESERYLTDAQRAAMLHGVIEGYYAGGYSEVVFDNNRRWTANVGLLAHLYPDSVMLACVRDPRAIVDSFERLFQKNPMHLSVIVGGVSNTTVYERVTELMKPTGVVGFSLNAFRTAFFGPFNKRVVVVEYDDLARFPAAVMQDVYKVLGEEPFNHNFQAIHPILGAAEFDKELGAPGLHDLKPEVIYEPRTSILPPDILSALPLPFWHAPEPGKEAVTLAA